MNSTDPNESWNEEKNFLSGALRGAANEMPGGEVDDLHVSFGVVRDRVRRRRAVKIGGVTGASLALVGVLAFGAAQTPLLDSEPVLPGTSSESAVPEGSASPSREPSPSGTPASSVIQDDYQPSWLEWSDLRCGMPAADLETTTAGWSVASGGDIYARTSDQGGEAVPTWHMAATTEGGTLDVPPVLVWSQDGVVVDVGTNVFEGPVQSEPLLGAGDGAVQAEGGAYTTCAPSDGDAGDVFETPLPEGDYDIRVVAFPQAASGEFATAVSDPVSVRLDADGAHTATGTRGGPATIEPPEPAEGELSRFVLDRSTDRVTAELTQRGYVTTGTPSVTAECESTDPADEVTYELSTPSSGVFGTGKVPCDGSPFESEPVVGGGEELVDIRLTSVPDGVAGFWAVLAPGSDDGGDAAGDCSASGLDTTIDPSSPLAGPARETAQAIVDAAAACDSDRLIELANQAGTELMSGTETPEQTFALPDDTLHYLTLVGLLTGTGGQVSGENAGSPTVVWPRVATEEFRDSDEAWQEVVDAGVLTPGEAQSQRADETFGYNGMTIGINEDGSWRYYSASD